MIKKTIVLLLLCNTLTLVAQFPGGNKTYEGYRLWKKERQKQTDSIYQWVIKDTVMYETKIPEGIIKYHGKYKLSSTKGDIMPPMVVSIELIRREQSEILWDTSVFKIRNVFDIKLKDHLFSFAGRNGDIDIQMVSTAYNPSTKKWQLAACHYIPTTSFVQYAQLVGINLYRNNYNGSQICRINNYGELEIYKLTKYRSRNKNVPLLGLSFLIDDDELRKKINRCHTQYFQEITDTMFALQLSKELFSKKKTNNWITKDTILFEKELPQGIIRFYGNYQTNGRKRQTKPVDTYIELIQPDKVTILWDTSMVKIVGSIDKTDFVLDKDTFGENGIRGTVFTFRTDQAELISTGYNTKGNKYLLLGYQNYKMSKETCKPTTTYLIGVHTLFYYSPCDTLPQIYRLNECGELEIYELNEIRLRDKSIPLPGIPNLAEMELLHEKKREPYYYYLEQKNKLMPPIK
jgi:hypothetical protein